MKTPENICRLFYHECQRQYGDRILMTHDYRWFSRALKAVCQKHFFDKDISGFDFTQILHPEDSDSDPAIDDFPLQNPDSILFSTLNEEVEGYYMESSQPKKIIMIIERMLDKYNEIPEVKKLNLVLYEDMYRNIFKILRAVNMHQGHLIIVGLRGFATQDLVRLSCFISQKVYGALDMNPDFNDTDWQQELRNIILCAGQDNKPLLFSLEEYRITEPQWYRDIETIMTDNAHSLIMAGEDLPRALTKISKQMKRRGGEQTESQGNELNLRSSFDSQQQEQQEGAPLKKSLTSVVKRNVNDIYTTPKLFNEMYKQMTQRIAKNLRFVIHFTPSGQSLREKMQNHSQLMHNSQIMWVQHLKEADLLEVGEKTFVGPMEEEMRAELIRDTTRDPRLDEIKVKKSRDANMNVLKAFVDTYQLVIKFSRKYEEKNKHILYFTPQFFLRSLQVYRKLLKVREHNVTETQNRFEKGLDKLKETLQKV